MRGKEMIARDLTAGMDRFVGNRFNFIANIAVGVQETDIFKDIVINGKTVSTKTGTRKENIYVARFDSSDPVMTEDSYKCRLFIDPIQFSRENFYELFCRGYDNAVATEKARVSALMNSMAKP